MKINNKCKTSFLLKLSFCFAIIVIAFLLSNKCFAATDAGYKYLSDEDINPTSVRVGWDAFRKDEINGNGKISVKIEGAYYTFDRGLWAHAASTIIYDLTEYDYDYFTAYIGLNQTASSSSNGVIFKIYTSADGRNWNIKYNEDSAVCKPGSNATPVKIDIRTEKFLKLEAGSNGSNGSDHSVYADAKLIKGNYKEPGEELVPSIEELDTKIKAFVASGANLETNSEYEYTLLKRELINNVGNYALKRYLGASQENQETFRWLIGNKDNYENLKLYVLGGKPDGGSYYNSLTILSELYNEYASDFNNPELLNNPTYPNMTYGYLYKKMAMSIALTHSQRVGLWMQSSRVENQSDPLRRYAIFKYMHKNGGMIYTSTMDMTRMFEDLHIQEMRLVLYNNIDDEEILWLNRYVQDNVDRNPNNVWRYTTPHPYIAYIWPNYQNSVYYDPKNENYFNELFAINKTDNNVGRELVNENGEKTGKIGIFDSEFVIPGGKNNPEYRIKVTKSPKENITTGEMVYKVWMNFRNKFGTGCVCGGISKSGANIRGTHGIPAMVVGQPGHAALLFYTKDAQGRGYWRLDNDVSGWTLSGGGGRLLGWGNGSYTQGLSNGVYVELEQAAINDYENLVKAEELVMLAKVYNSDLADGTKKQAALAKQEEIYRKALEIQSINFDAWLGLIEVYKANTSKTENDFYDLAEELAENLKYFPLPMYNATNLIKPKLTTTENIYRFTLLQTRILTQAKNTPNNTADSFTVMQPGVTRLEASYLLGQLDQSIATFSFDGEDAGKIVLASRFDGSGVRWDYCITGKGENQSWEDAKWNEASFSAEEEHKLQLTPEQIASITAENDIYVHIVGVNYDEKNLYKIDITEQSLPSNVYANDWENRVIGVDSNTEWRYTENDNWTLFRDSSKGTPDLTGNKTIQIRQAATGTKLASPVSEVYTFTEDNWTDKRKYVPIEHLSIHSYSTQSKDSSRPYYAPNAIDGNIHTMWHTDFAENVLQTGNKPFIAIELDEPRNISAVEFVQNKWKDSDPVYIKNAIIYVSNDGETWIEAGRTENCAQNLEFKSVEFDSVYAKYVKFEMDTYSMFSSLAMVNLFEDVTKVTIAHFSFNGDNAGQIVLIDEFKGKDWEYSLNGGSTWKSGTGDAHTLTEAELKQINSNDGIKVRSNGKESTISIKEQEAPTISAYLNDLENRLIGINDVENLEWKIEGNANWTSYTEKEPIVTGDKKLLIRKKAAGTLMPSAAVEFAFTDDNQPDTAKYVPIKHLSIHSFSNTTPNRGEPATNAIDALPTTMWHTNRTTTTMKDPRWIVIELDETRYISKIEYVRKAAYAYGIMKNGKISVSMDGENWEVAHTIENLYNPTTSAELTSSENSKDIVFAESKQAKYIKIECTESCDYVHGNRNGVPMDYFFSAAMFNIFEDLTKVERPTASIKYSTEKLTNKDVTATLVNENMDIIVTNNNGSKTYTFTENGTFTFEFVNNKGIKGTATAEVNNIDKTMPNPTIEYSTKNPTNGNVTATIKFDKENVTIKFEFIGPAGNEGTAVATVANIDRNAPVATITYSAEYKTNQDIIATIKFDKENVTITNNNGNNTYTFTENGTFTFNFVDEAGNSGTAVATVANIDRNLPVATITYDITNLTNQNVIATITFDKSNVTITNNNGSNTYTFIENDTFTFEFVGPSGNAGIAVASVDWIDKKAPIATISYDIENKLTNKDVTATITFNKENVQILNNDGNNTYKFELNGEFTFKFRDQVGNEGTATAEVEWIDKKVPVPTVTYSINDITNQDVTATVTFDKAGVTIVNDKGQEIENGNTYTFTENGSHEFKFVGPAGNTGTATAEVTWIDKTPPAAIITYDISEPTNKDVTATVTFDEGGVTIVNDEGQEIENGDKYVFTQNGSYTFNYVGPLGNLGTAVATVNWIDKTAPTAQIDYSKTSPTNEDVTVTLVNASEEITITNNNGNNTYTFTENGTFTFEFIDRVGNKGTAIATVNNIDKKVPVATITYSTEQPTTDKVIATITFDKENVTVVGGNTHVFTKNDEYTFEFEDEFGNKGTAIAKVDWIKEKEEPIPTRLKGDTDGDGEITINDLAQIKLHLIEIRLLEGIDKTVADMDDDGEITVNDLALLKMIIIGIE